MNVAKLEGPDRLKNPVDLRSPEDLSATFPLMDRLAGDYSSPVYIFRPTQRLAKGKTT